MIFKCPICKFEKESDKKIVICPTCVEEMNCYDDPKTIETRIRNFRWKKLNETLTNIEEPIGILQVISSCVWGEQSREQKLVSEEINNEAIGRLKL